MSWTIALSDDPGTRHVCFHFRGSQVGCFEVDAGFVATELDADPRHDPFEVIDMLADYLKNSYALASLDLVYHIYLKHRDEVIREFLEGELFVCTNLRADLEAQLQYAMECEAQIRNELQSLPIQKATPEGAASVTNQN